jgi:hypothetical protein
MQKVAARQYGVPETIIVKDIRKGRLYGMGNVFYANKTNGQKRKMTGEVGYAGEILVNGKTETVYFLAGCGNDVRVGSYMKNLTFIPDTDPINIPKTPVESSQNATETKEVNCKNQVQLKMLEIGEKAVSEGWKKKVFMKLSADGSLEVNINDGNQQKPETQASTSEKK